jgi:dephospho-CoA kinase
MRLIGLTGGIATGKSTVAAMLTALGAAVVDADALAREVLLPGTSGLDEVVARFGGTILDAGGGVDRAALGALVFADPGKRAALEAITHPRIAALMQDRILAALDSPAPLVVADIPLLFERDGQQGFEGTLLVYAPAATQLQRMRDRDGLDEDASRSRLAAQLPIDEKRRRATWVIDNSGSRESTAAQVDAWWAEVLPTG